MRRIFVFLLLLVSSAYLYAGKKDTTSRTEPFFTLFRTNSVAFGVPLNTKIDKETLDVKFRLSIRTRNFTIGKKWGFFFGYTQISVWNAWGESSPFRDNQYMPGFYFNWHPDDKSVLYLGVEHRSNGRPYFGNKLAEEGYDDLSRGMNYIYIHWKRSFQRHEYGITGRAGFGCGVGTYKDHFRFFSQDLLLRYIGYVTGEHSYQTRHFGCHIELSPIWNESIINIQTELKYRFSEKWPYIFIEFHYGYDETLCSCVPNAKPPANIRFGFAYKLPTSL